MKFLASSYFIALDFLFMHYRVCICFLNLVSRIDSKRLCVLRYLRERSLMVCLPGKLIKYEALAH